VESKRTRTAEGLPYCLAMVPLMRRWGPWRGSAAALGVWGVVAAGGYWLVLA
jgi:hypothetical protein